MPYTPALPPVKTTTRRSEDFRETPRLVVDSLQGNVFVNQYLVIKQLGRGAHGSVKLVFDTEQQLVHAMKVIHCKAARGTGTGRRPSLSLDSPAVRHAASVRTAVSTGSPALALSSGLFRGNSLSADASQLQACAGERAGVSRSGSLSPYPTCGSPVKSGPSFAAAYAAAIGAAPPAVSTHTSTPSSAVEEVSAAAPNHSAQQPQPQQQLQCFGSMTPCEQLPLPAADPQECARDPSQLPSAPAAALQAPFTQPGGASLLAGQRPPTPLAGAGINARSCSPAPMPLSAVADAATPQLAREVVVMKHLNHPNVVKLFEVVHDPEQKLLIMVMEFMPGGPILSSSRAPGLATEPLGEPAARTYFRELVSALDYLHRNLIMHGDLKPDNLLLSADGRLKISDFGSAILLPQPSSQVTTSMGTPAFMAPEMCGLNGAPFAPFPAELWAAGVCVFMFVYGRVPYVSSSTGALYDAIRSPEPVSLPEQPELSPQLRDLLARMLDKDSTSRICLEEVLSHDWVTDSGKLPAVHQTSSQSGTAEAQAKETGQVLTALKKQVKTAVPNVEERTYKKGSLLVQQGQVAEGLFLILAGTCELVLLSHMPEQQQQQGGHITQPASPKQPSFTSKIAAAVQGSPKLQRTQSSSPVVAMPAKRDTDLDFAAQLSDSDETTDSEDDDGGGGGLQQQQQFYSGCLQAEQQGAALDPEAIKPGFPFFRLTASADGAQRLQPPGGLLLGRPWPPPAAGGRASLPSPPPIIEGVPCSLSGQDDGFSCDWQAVEGQQEREDSSARLPSMSNSGGWVPGHNPGPDSPRGDAGSQPGSRRAAGHAKSCSVDYGVLGEPRPVKPHNSTGNLLQPSLPVPAAAPAPAAATPGGTLLSAGLQRFHALQVFSRTGRGGSERPSSPADLSYSSLSQASAPNLGCQWGSRLPAGAQSDDAGEGGAGSFSGGCGGLQLGRASPLPAGGGLQVQRSAHSMVVGASGKVYHRAMRRSESMHKRMVDLVAAAKMRTQTNSKRHELVGIRGPGQIIGDTSLNGKPAPAAATVRARSRMRVLLVRPADAAALVSQPSIKAALYRTQTESSVLDALETFAAYDGEVAAIDEVRRSRAASFAAATARGGGVGGLLGSGRSGIQPGISGAGQGSGQWLATASSVGSSVGPLESYNSVASSLASFTSAVAAVATAAGGSMVGGASQSALQAAAAAAAATAGRGRSSPTVLLTSPPARVPSWTAGGFGNPNLASAGPGDALFVGGAGPDRSGSPSTGPLGSPLRPGSRGNSFTAGSTTPRGGLRGTSSRLGLSVQIAGGQQVMSPVTSPRVYLQMEHKYTV